MPSNIMIRGRPVQVDIERELDAFEWNRKSVRGGKLLACSPFRKDGKERHPSFAVRLDNGVWIDSGSSDTQWRQGSFIRLLAALRGEEESEVEEYLLTLYDTQHADVEKLSLDLKLKSDESYKGIERSPIVLDPFKFRHPYLERRGINEETQRLFRIGYDRNSKAITIPWANCAGVVVNIKYRSVIEKKFWYHSGGEKISNHVYGLDLIVSRGIDRVYVTEAEIDCMYLWANGFPAVAVGGSNMSDVQRQHILRAGIRDLVIATDNDPAGVEAGERISSKLSGWIDLYKLVIPHGRKDVNELSPQELIAVTERIKPFPYSFV
ncbi:toprim domain-containing protein [Paenibacillus sp. 1P03SA]|uniref:toprim domain-containing protein n=1 Tax=Paenibacillus sp. 1P03SA TaxID=3132294 RepID=UPI0039A20A5F